MSTQTFNQAKKLIQHFEGFSPQVYTCAGGVPTIGYGHRVYPQEKMPAIITKAMGESLLDQDLHHTSQAIARLIKVPLLPNQWIALMSFTFNVGAGALQRSTLRQKINRNEHKDVPSEFLKWVFVNGHKNKGLLRRRELEKNIYYSTCTHKS